VLKPVLADLGRDGDPACWLSGARAESYGHGADSGQVWSRSTVRLTQVAATALEATRQAHPMGQASGQRSAVDRPDGHRLVPVQVEGQSQGVDEEATDMRVLLGLVAGVDGRAYRVAAPVVCKRSPPDVTIPSLPSTSPRAKGRRKVGLKRPMRARSPVGRGQGPAGSRRRSGPWPGPAAARQTCEDLRAARPRAAWVASASDRLPAPQTPTPAVAPLRLKPPAAKPERPSHRPRRRSSRGRGPVREPAEAGRLGSPGAE